MENKDNNYLLSFFNQNLQEESFNEAEISSIKCNIMALLGQWTDRYTMGESSSVPVEKAEELLKSICFTLGLVVEKRGSCSLITNEMLGLLKSGWDIIESMLEESKSLFKMVKESTILTENISYNDTLKGIERFFKKYDYRFFAHEIPGDIDYQLSIPVPEDLQGIKYINEYLHRLLLENQFCEHFERNEIMRLLQSYCPDYKGLLINVFEPVAMNAMGLAVINKNVRKLDISDYDRKIILAELKNWEATAVRQLDEVVELICCNLNINEKEQKNYLHKTLSSQYPRVKNQVSLRNLEGLFLSLFDENKGDKIMPKYVDGNMMEDEELRKLIDAISSSKFTFEKISLVHENVHSLRDMIEVLNICFWDDEIMQLLKTFSNKELVLLGKFAVNKSKNWQSNTGWEKQLKNYLKI